MKALKLSHLIATGISLLCLSISLADAQTDSKATSLSESEKQRQELSKTYGITVEQAALVQKFSYSRTRQIDSLSKLGLPTEEFRDKRESVTDEYYMKIFSILTSEQQKLFDIDAFKAARTGEVKVLHLPAMKAIEMGRIKAGYLKAVKELDEANLSTREYRDRKSGLDRKYRSDLKAFLGEKKFAQWKEYKDSENERRFKQNFGFTDEQYKKYVSIENALAIEILKIKNSSLPAAEREQKIAEAKSRKVEAMKEMLPKDAFDKWFDYHQRKENKRR